MPLGEVRSVRTVHCEGCDQEVVVPDSAGTGYRLDCPNCAGVTLRLAERDGQLVAVAVKKVSCPDNDEVIELPDDARAGDIVACGGRRYRLTYEWGSFSAEPLAE